MLLKNKKTWEIRELPDGFFCGDNLKKICEEWEDAPEEPKEYWYIECDGEVYSIERLIGYDPNKLKEIGNYFETKEEAEKAVEKLKAWKRLKDKGFRFDHIRSIDGVSIKHKDLNQYTIIAYADEDGCDQECLDSLFSGGEE